MPTATTSTSAEHPRCAQCARILPLKPRDPVTRKDREVEPLGKRIFARRAPHLGFTGTIWTVKGTQTKQDVDVAEVMAIGPDVNALRYGLLEPGQFVAFVRVVGIRMDLRGQFMPSKDGEYIFLHEDDILCTVAAHKVKDLRGETLVLGRPLRSA